MASGKDNRGRLEVFLGCAPGVGKTYEMLAEARGLAQDGRDVVIAVVEPHDRPDTAAMAEGIESIALREVTYRGTALTDMDLDAVLARRPEVALVDELAHTNSPGSAHSKRWQDIEELLRAGIDVLTTVNIQHLESLNDVIAQITGVVQQETVPDAVVRSADQIELVDITPQSLRQRLRAGKIYARNRIDGALTNYFRQGNLTALRELALLWLADQVDANLAEYRAAQSITDTWEARERVLVAVTGGAESPTLIRRASRIASRSSAELVVVHVVRDDGLVSQGATQLHKLADLAASVGAQIHTVVGDDVPATLLEFARGVNATQLVVGTSRRPRWRRMFSEGVGASVIHDSGRIDVHMVTHEERSRRNPFDVRRSRFIRPLSWLIAVVVPVATTGILSIFDRWLGFSSESALFFIAVLAVALLGGIIPAALSAVIAGLLLNFFFTTPRLTFTISDPDNLITIVVMLIIAVAVAALVDAANTRRTEALRASRDAEILTLFSDAVLGGADTTEMLNRVRETFDQQAISIVATSADHLERALASASESTERTSAPDGPETCLASVGDNPPRRASDADTVCPVGNGDFAMLMNGSRRSARDRRVLTSVATQIVGAIERQELESRAATAQALAQTDELRRALLSAVSHDLRTPLASAKIAASSLRSPELEFSAEDTDELLATIDESLDQLTTLIGNLLDSSRLAAGTIRPNMARTYLPEVIHRAAAAARRSEDTDAAITFDIAEPWAYTDPGLLERVLANVIDNAIHHGGSPVTVATTATEAGVDDPRCVIRVTDHGPGIPIHLREHIFDEKWNGEQSPGGGLGLGLAVASGFTTAMDGTVEASSTPGGGTTMLISLPLEASDPVTTIEAPHV